MEIIGEIMDTQENEKLERAKKRVEKIKGFYRHLKAYIVVNLLLLLIRSGILPIITIGSADMNMERWFDWNIITNAVLWGIVLLIHGLVVFQYKFKFFKAWEERKMKEFLDEENDKDSKKWN